MLHITNLKSNLKKEKQFFFSVHQLIQSYIPFPILARDDSGKLPTTVQNLQCNLYLPAVNVTYVYIHLYQGSYNIINFCLLFSLIQTSFMLQLVMKYNFFQQIFLSVDFE